MDMESYKSVLHIPPTVSEKAICCYRIDLWNPKRVDLWNRKQETGQLVKKRAGNLPAWCRRRGMWRGISGRRRQHETHLIEAILHDGAADPIPSHNHLRAVLAKDGEYAVVSCELMNTEQVPLEIGDDEHP